MTERAARAPLPIAPLRKPTAPLDRATIEARRTAREYPFTTKVMPWRPDTSEIRVFADVASGVEALDAANECEHGWLLSDTPPRAAREDLVELWDACREAGCVVARKERPAHTPPVEAKKPAITTAEATALGRLGTGPLKASVSRDCERELSPPETPAARSVPPPGTELQGLAGETARRLAVEIDRLAAALARVRRTHASPVTYDSNGGRDGS